MVRSRKHRIQEWLPFWLRKWILGLHQRFVLYVAIPEFRERIDNDRVIPDDLIEKLIYGWGNIGYSAHSSYTRAIIENVLQTEGPVLECGSGLTSVIMGIIAKRRNIEIWTIEHHPIWAASIKKSIKRLGLNNVHIVTAPLKHHQDFDWYDLPLDQLPNDFRMVICDGPPGYTRGGRFGLLPVMKEKLKNGCIILLDDYMREEERQVVIKWRNDYDLEVKEKGYPDIYAEIRLSK